MMTNIQLGLRLLVYLCTAFIVQAPCKQVLGIGQETRVISARVVGHFPDVEEHEEVEDGESSEGQHVHEDQVHPGDVDADVGRVLTQVGHHDLGSVAGGQVGLAGPVGVGFGPDLPRDLEEPRDVVEDGEDDGAGNPDLGLAVGADS